jgi:menaquinone-dependent protoporphyrinogen oxidase
MPDVLVVYASTHGHTEKIAARVADAVREDGTVVHVHEAGAAGELVPSAYDAVIVGASVHGGHYQHDVRSWVKRHALGLQAMPTAFFSVCLTAADDTDESRESTRKYIDDFLDETGWTPREAVTFAGALQYLEYDFATRLVMRLLMRHGHHETDTSRDYDYTDWDAVDRFGRDCAAMLAVPAEA